MLKKRVIISVINDLVTDQRVLRTATVLKEQGYEVLLVGRKLKNSLPTDTIPYNVHRFNMLFKSGIAFYFFFNLRLLFYLLFKKSNLLWANDLDTLGPNYIVSGIRSIPLVYDSHEIFCEVPELQRNKLKKRIWELLEKMIVPKLKHMITVNESIASYFYNKYNVKCVVLRNIPRYNFSSDSLKSRKQLGIPDDKIVLILQGAGINVDRGAEELLKAVKDIDSVFLIIAGSGDVVHVLKKYVAENDMHQKVVFKDKMPFLELIHYTAAADIGLTLDKNSNINYRFSLPNKLFDYIHAGIAVVASDLVEVKKIVLAYDIGRIVPSESVQDIKKTIEILAEDKNSLQVLKQNTLKAKLELNWENEKKGILNLLAKIEQKNSHSIV